MLAILLILVAGSTAVAQDSCRPPEFVLNEASGYIDNFSAADALDALAPLQASYACTEPADPAVLGKLWLAEGMARVYAGEIEAARPPFAAASRVAPDVWPASYGDRDFYDEAAAAPAPPGNLRLVPSPVGLWVAVDGAVVDTPIDLPSGLHMVQVGYPDNPAGFARFVTIPAAGEQQLSHGLQPAQQEVAVVLPPTVSKEPKKPKKPKHLATAVGLGVTGLALFGGSVGTRLYYDDQANQYDAAGQNWLTTTEHVQLGIAIDAMFIGSVVLGAGSVWKLAKAAKKPKEGTEKATVEGEE